jgi:hypothetical protein
MQLIKTLARKLRKFCQPFTVSRSFRRKAFQTLALEELEPRLALHGEPHPDNPVLAAEHLAVFNLVKVEDATAKAVISGEWDQPATWEGGVLPGDRAKVLIPAGITVTLDSVQPEMLYTLRIDGTLTFKTNVNTSLLVDTIVVDPMGTLAMGTSTDPIQPNVEAKIVIADSGPIDVTWDPNQFSRGLISHGTVSIVGDTTTSYAPLARPILKGTQQFNVTGRVKGWTVGDRLIITSTHSSQNQDEERKIVAIRGNRVTVDQPFAFAHTSPEAKLPVYVANVSRNAVIQSQNPFLNDRRGHVMLMHKPNISINYAGFYGLGRTDKRNPLHNVELDAAGQAVPGTGKNQVGRYALHVHRTGLDASVPPVVVRGSAVVDSPGWGFVNHSSNVAFEDNVVFDVVGAAYVTEVGNEIGAFRRNLAVRSRGSGDGTESRADRQDFGHQGDGFWFQGAGIEVQDNVAVGQRHAGYVYFTRGLVENGLGTAEFLASNLVDPSWAAGAEHIDVGDVPIRLFKNNTAYASGDGFQTWFHLRNVKHTGRSVVEGLKVWNTQGGNAVFIPYTNQTTLRNVIVLGNPAKFSGTGIGRNDVTANIIYDNVRVENFEKGIAAPVNGSNLIQGGRFQNIKNIEITTATSRNRVVDINGRIQFRSPSKALLGDRTPFNIFLQTNFNPKERDLSRLFYPDVILLGTVRFNGQQLFYLEQAANFIPFPAPQAADYVPKGLIDKTNQQLFDTYGLAIGGIVAPAKVTTNPKINGLIGQPVTYPPELTLLSRKYTNQLENYRLVYRDAAGTRVVDPTPVNLQEGWNLLTRDIAGQKRTFMVYGDITKATFQATPTLSLVINPLDLKKGFLVTGKVDDNSTGTKNFKKVFADLDQLPVQTQTRPDGSTFDFIQLRFTIKDRAGNATEITLYLTLDPNAPRQADRDFEELAERSLSITLLSLLDILVDDV